MRNILITGGTGFIGSHITIELIKKGYSVVLLDSLINSSENIIDKIKFIVKNELVDFASSIEFIKGDIRDKIKLDEIFIKYERLNKPIEAVIHCAGLKSVSESIYTPYEYWDVNVVGTLNLLKIMEKFNCKKIVFSSSATIYGDSKDNLIKEDNSISPVNTYGSTKAAVEEILKNFFEKKDAFYSIAILRYFNPIGAHPSGYIGELPKNKPNNLFPFITQVAKKQRTNLDVFGNNWPTIDGTGVRDYIHILDLADGHLEALEYLFKNKKRIIRLNLGTGLGTSVLELVRTFETVNKIKIPIRFVRRREGDVAKLVADNSEAKKILNWEPKRNIKDMCIDGWNYIKNLK